MSLKPNRFKLIARSSRRSCGRHRVFSSAWAAPLAGSLQAQEKETHAHSHQATSSCSSVKTAPLITSSPHMFPRAEIRFPTCYREGIIKAGRHAGPPFLHSSHSSRR